MKGKLIGISGNLLNSILSIVISLILVSKVWAGSLNIVVDPSDIGLKSFDYNLISSDQNETFIPALKRTNGQDVAAIARISRDSSGYWWTNFEPGVLIPQKDSNSVSSLVRSVDYNNNTLAVIVSEKKNSTTFRSYLIVYKKDESGFLNRVGSKINVTNETKYSSVEVITNGNYVVITARNGNQGRAVIRKINSNNLSSSITRTFAGGELSAPDGSITYQALAELSNNNRLIMLKNRKSLRGFKIGYDSNKAQPTASFYNTDSVLLGNDKEEYIREFDVDDNGLVVLIQGLSNEEDLFTKMNGLKYANINSDKLSAATNFSFGENYAYSYWLVPDANIEYNDGVVTFSMNNVYRAHPSSGYGNYVKIPHFSQFRVSNGQIRYLGSRQIQENNGRQAPGHVAQFAGNGTDVFWRNSNGRIVWMDFDLLIDDFFGLTELTSSYPYDWDSLVMNKPAISGNYLVFLGSLYKKVNGQWVLLEKLPKLYQDAFGRADIDMNSNFLVVGWGDSTDNAGEVFYRESNADYSESFKKLPLKNHNSKLFGRSVALSGNLLAVGSNEAVIVYKWANGEWKQKKIVNAPRKNKGFGSAVDISGKSLIVGAPGEGKAYIYNKPSKGWNYINTGQHISRTGYGVTVSITDKYAATGSNNETRVLLRTKNNGNWGSQTSLNIGGTGVLTPHLVNDKLTLVGKDAQLGFFRNINGNWSWQDHNYFGGYDQNFGGDFDGTNVAVQNINEFNKVMIYQPTF